MVMTSAIMNVKYLLFFCLFAGVRLQRSLVRSLSKQSENERNPQKVLALILFAHSPTSIERFGHRSSRSYHQRAHLASTHRAAGTPLLAEAPPREQEINRLIKELFDAPLADVPKIVAERNNLRLIDKDIFFRFAEMEDAAKDESEKKRISDMSELVLKVSKLIAEKIDERTSAEATTVQGLLSKMALASGEFVIPVPPAQLSAVRVAIRDALPLDEGFVGTVKAYIQKVTEDKLEGMPDILRLLLQIFCAEWLRKKLTAGKIGGDEDVKEVFVALLDATPTEWDGIMRVQLAGESAKSSADEFAKWLQKDVSELVMELDGGSSTQVTLAEYVNELISRSNVIIRGS